jgi:hypothetical protein
MDGDWSSCRHDVSTPLRADLHVLSYALMNTTRAFDTSSDCAAETPIAAYDAQITDHCFNLGIFGGITYTGTVPMFTL